MNILIAIDSFKGSISSLDSAKAIEEGIRKVYIDANVNAFPIADGGEGTVDAIVSCMNGEFKNVRVHNPLGNIIESKYGVVGETAIIEMASAAGITLVTDKERNPMNTTTYGVGEMIKDAVENGYRDFVIGIGGSATNDGGTGMLAALGYEFLTKEGKKTELGAKGLKELYSISDKNALKELSECTFNVACDVINPLCGPLGCSRIYGPQKGADEDMIIKMDKWLDKYAELSKTINKNADKNFRGAGAAGGMGFAFKTFLNANLTPGVELILNKLGINEKMAQADIVITGEGRLDNQTSMGKAPTGVSKLAKKYNKPVIAFSGVVSEGAEKCNDCGIDAFFPIIRRVCTTKEAMNTENAYKNLRDTVEQTFRLIKTFR